MPLSLNGPLCCRCLRHTFAPKLIIFSIPQRRQRPRARARGKNRQKGQHFHSQQTQSHRRQQLRDTIQHTPHKTQQPKGRQSIMLAQAGYNPMQQQQRPHPHMNLNHHPLPPGPNPNLNHHPPPPSHPGAGVSLVDESAVDWLSRDSSHPAAPNSLRLLQFNFPLWKIIGMEESIQQTQLKQGNDPRRVEHFQQPKIHAGRKESERPSFSLLTHGMAIGSPSSHPIPFSSLSSQAR